MTSQMARSTDPMCIWASIVLNVKKAVAIAGHYRGLVPREEAYPGKAIASPVQADPTPFPGIWKKPGRSADSEDVRGLVDRSPADDGGQDADVRDPFGFSLERVLVQDDEVGELTRLERADLALPVAGEGGPGGVQGQRVRLLIPPSAQIFTASVASCPEWRPGRTAPTWSCTTRP